MAVEPISDTVLVSPRAADNDRGSYVDWPAIFAGIVLASAISVVLLAFGSAVGLSFTSFKAREGASPLWLGIAAASWLLWVQVSSFMAGGYITGRLRRPFSDATEHERDVRDGAHGLLVWAGSLVIGAILATAGIGAIANAIGNVAGTAVEAASNVADGDDPNGYLVDTLFRAPASAATDPAPAQPAPGGMAVQPVAPANTLAVPLDASTRGEVTRIFANAVIDPVPQEDSAYLVSLVARQTGLPQAEAQARVDAALARFEQAKAQAVDAAETARRTGVIAAFLAAAALFVSAAGAWWAASMGGRHRDENTVFASFFRRY
jgi:hypothetical protein